MTTPASSRGLSFLWSVHVGYVKYILHGSHYCLIIVCFGAASGILRVVSEGLPKPSRSRPEADMFQITQKQEKGTENQHFSEPSVFKKIAEK